MPLKKPDIDNYKKFLDKNPAREDIKIKAAQYLSVASFTTSKDRRMLGYTSYKKSILNLLPPNLMSQVLDPLPSDSNDNIICCYVNATSQIQIARVTNVANWYFERVVFPGQRLVFEANPEGILEIHSGMMASAILSDTIPCLRLALQAVGTNEAANGSKKAVA